MSPEEKIAQLYKNADFDKKGFAQNKVYAKIHKRKRGARALWLMAGAAAIFAALVFWPRTADIQKGKAQLPVYQDTEVTQEE